MAGLRFEQYVKFLDSRMGSASHQLCAIGPLVNPLGLCFFYSGDNVTLSISSVEYEDKMRLQTKDRATGTRKPRKGFFFFSGEVITTLSQLHCLPIKQMSFLHLKSASRLCLFLPTK